MAVLVAGCASSGTPDTATPAAAGGPGLTISVLNEHASASTSVLFIEAVGGIRQSLGTVRAGSSANFSFAATPGMAYLLIQQTEAGETSSSDRFTFSGPTAVTWDLSTRRLTVLRR